MMESGVDDHHPNSKGHTRFILLPTCSKTSHDCTLVVSLSLCRSGAFVLLGQTDLLSLGTTAHWWPSSFVFSRCVCQPCLGNLHAQCLDQAACPVSHRDTISHLDAMQYTNACLASFAEAFGSKAIFGGYSEAGAASFAHLKEAAQTLHNRRPSLDNCLTHQIGPRSWRVRSQHR